MNSGPNLNLWIIPLLPLAGAAINGFFGRRFSRLLVSIVALGSTGITFETLLVPGHSPAHLAFHAEGCLFSGDVLFAGSVGRTDLPGADWETLVESIRLLSDRFPPETIVYPGHGVPTTLGAELDRNPFLAPLRAS